MRHDFYVIGKSLADQNDLNQHGHHVSMVLTQTRGEVRIARQIKNKTDMILIGLRSLEKEKQKLKCCSSEIQNNLKLGQQFKKDINDRITQMKRNVTLSLG